MDKRLWSQILFVSGLVGLIASSFQDGGFGNTNEAVVSAIFFVGGLFLWYFPQEIANEIKRSLQIDNSTSTEHQDKLLELLQKHSYAMGKNGRSGIVTTDDENEE